MAPTAPGAVPVGPGDTGTCPGPGRTSELLGFGCGVTVTVGGGSCAAAPPTDNSTTVRPQQTRRIVLMKSIPNIARRSWVNISARAAFLDHHQMKLIGGLDLTLKNAIFSENLCGALHNLSQKFCLLVRRRTQFGHGDATAPA